MTTTDTSTESGFAMSAMPDHQSLFQTSTMGLP